MKNLSVFVLLLSVSISVFSQNIAQWRGPQRNGIYSETNLLKDWGQDGPKLLWSGGGLGMGNSSVTVGETMIYTTGTKDSTDYLTAMNFKGETVWQVPMGLAWNQSFPEARCTPTLENGNLYVVSGRGTISCFNAADGKAKWTFDGFKKFNGACGDWGVCESLLLVDDKLIYTPAGSTTTMVALNKNTGETIWQSECLKDTSAYVSPVVIDFAKKKIIVTAIANHLFGTDAVTGKILWKYNYAKLKPEAAITIWPGAPQTNTISPLFKDGNLYITGGYNHVGAMFKLAEDASAVSLAWIDTVLDCHHGGVVLVDDYIYGSNWINNGTGNWCCIDWKTGKKMYEEFWNSKGSIVAADGMLYIYDEKKGNVGLVKANPQKFELASSFKVTQGKGPHWAHPVINKGVLYVRHGEFVMAYEIKK